ncbi:hypothetical protein BaRGS_00027441 [Batillaria attramentaria]|uniref:Uncharacterized protein n=1 Tax=Batillaria attramentaria TaxID=370345 RepID=A0ABD0K2W9_9CAEN
MLRLNVASNFPFCQEELLGCASCFCFCSACDTLTGSLLLHRTPERRSTVLREWPTSVHYSVRKKGDTARAGIINTRQAVTCKSLLFAIERGRLRLGITIAASVFTCGCITSCGRCPVIGPIMTRCYHGPGAVRAEELIPRPLSPPPSHIIFAVVVPVDLYLFPEVTSYY